MEFHPSQIPVRKTYDVSDEQGAAEAAEEIASLWSAGGDSGFKVIMPGERRLAQRAGHTVMTTLSYALRQARKERNVRYWVYREDPGRYAIVLIDASALERLGL